MLRLEASLEEQCFRSVVTAMPDDLWEEILKRFLPEMFSQDFNNLSLRIVSNHSIKNQPLSQVIPANLDDEVETIWTAYSYQWFLGDPGNDAVEMLISDDIDSINEVVDLGIGSFENLSRDDVFQDIRREPSYLFRSKNQNIHRLKFKNSRLAKDFFIDYLKDQKTNWFIAGIVNQNQEFLFENNVSFPCHNEWSSFLDY